MSDSYQSGIPRARVNIQLSLHTGGAQKKVELPLKLMMVGDYSNGAEQRPLSECKAVSINKNNFDSVLSEFEPEQLARFVERARHRLSYPSFFAPQVRWLRWLAPVT